MVRGFGVREGVVVGFPFAAGVCKRRLVSQLVGRAL
jgi:hypothetical protein